MVTCFGCSPTVEPQQSCARTQLWVRQDAGTRRAKPESQQDGSWFMAQRAVDWRGHWIGPSIVSLVRHLVPRPSFFGPASHVEFPGHSYPRCPISHSHSLSASISPALVRPLPPRPSSERNHSTPSALRACYLPLCPPFSRSSPARIGVLTALLSPSWVALTPERLLSRL